MNSITDDRVFRIVRFNFLRTIDIIVLFFESLRLDYRIAFV